MSDPVIDQRLAEFVGKYAPEIALAIEACRAKLHALFPRGFELVYDNYNALVFGFGPSERTSEALLSLAAYPRWVTLFFLHGANLEDPGSLLQGSGSQVRSVRLASAQDLDRLSILDLIERAVAPSRAAFGKAPVRSTIIKSVSVNQRPRRPGESKAKGKSPSSSKRARL